MSALPLSTTSLAAYHSLDLPELERKALEAVESFGPIGCTKDEILRRFPHFTHETLTPRFAPLERKGLVYREGDTRVGLSGRQQKVMRHITFATKPSAPVKKPKNNPFLAGLMRAAKLVIETDPKLKGTPVALALKSEILKVARK